MGLGRFNPLVWISNVVYGYVLQSDTGGKAIPARLTYRLVHVVSLIEELRTETTSVAKCV